MAADLPGLVQQIAHYEARLQADPGSRAFLPLADLYRRAGRLEQARQILSRGLAGDPDCLSARVLFGEVLAGLGEEDAARRELTAVLDRDRDNLVALRLLGEDAAARGDWQRARECQERLLRLLPEASGVRSALEETRRRLAAARTSPTDAPGGPAGGGGEARPPVEEGTAAGSGLETPTLAELYRRQGHRAKAREILERILAVSPQRADALAVLARLETEESALSTADLAEPAGQPAAAASQRPAADQAAAGDRQEDLQRFRLWLESDAQKTSPRGDRG